MLQPQRALKALESWETVSPRNQKRELPRAGGGLWSGVSPGASPQTIFFTFFVSSLEVSYIESCTNDSFHTTKLENG